MLRLWAHEVVPHTSHEINSLFALPVQQVQGRKTQEGLGMGVFIVLTAVLAFTFAYERLTRCA